MAILENCVIIENKMLTDRVYSMVVAHPGAREALSGQFAQIYVGLGEHLLPRPISFCEINEKKGTLRFVYEVVGSGTEYFKTLKPNDTVRVLAPLGNGFDLSLAKGKRVALVGGGLGAAPLVDLCARLSDYAPHALMGFTKDADVVFKQEFMNYTPNLFVATMEGGHDFRGNSVELLSHLEQKFDVIYACGPTPMLMAVADVAEKMGAVCQVSMEARMACGFGVCVGCAVAIKSEDGFVYKKACVDGPVFDSREVYRG